MSDSSKDQVLKPFFKLITAEEAYEHLQRLSPLATESVDVREAEDRVLAEDVHARDNVPHFFRSNMDGFALRAADTYSADDSSAVRLKLIGQVGMGEDAVMEVSQGSAVRISTGGMMPPGADAVVMVEKTETRNGTVIIREPLRPRQNTVAIGEDMKSGDLVLPAGRRLRGADIGAVCGVGRTTVKVHRIARVGVFATGDEIVEPDADLQPGQVRNINQYLLAAAARRLGCEVNDYGVVPDDEEKLRSTLLRAVSECDAVFMSGGSSMGTRDFSLQAISELPGFDIVFHGLAMAPGKPTILARSQACAVMGLPGNPAAAAVVFELFGVPLLRILEGEDGRRIMLTRPRARARLGRSVSSSSGREEYQRVKLEAGEDMPIAIPIPGKSVAISTMAKADALLRIPLSTEGIPEGAEVEVLLLG